jgi:hypothetical protein
MRGAHGAVQQRDAADEGRLEQCGSTFVGNKVIVDQAKVVRPSQLIASVRRTHGRAMRLTGAAARGIYIVES